MSAAPADQQNPAENNSSEDWEDDDGDWEEPYCDHCQNSGTIDCHCGGDFCICMNHGEKICPWCLGI